MSNIRMRAKSATEYFAFRNGRAPRAKFWWASAAAAVALFGMPVDSAFAAGSAPLMAVPGHADVSGTGAFTYAIPIRVPPGTAGMAPSLALAYSSQAGDGYGGLGWSLAGLSSITRCPRTVTDDTVHGSVNFDPNDQFCLDGQKLVAISGTYGADGTEYRLQSDNFTKIISHGTAGSGPSWFTATLRNGTAVEYGNASSPYLAQFKPLKADGTGVSSSVLIWAVDKTTDIRGNTMTVAYTNDTTDSQIYPTEIDYTSNAGASLSAYNSVQFTYMTRSADVVPQYQAGIYTTVTKLLTHIRTYNSTTVVTDYQLAYNYASTGASHNELATFKQCDSSGTTCLAPTSFTWQGSRDAPSLNTGVDMNSVSQGFPLYAGDFNGDGLTDALVHDTSCPTGGVIWSGSSAGTFSRASMTANYTYYKVNDATTYTYNNKACFLDGTPISVGDFNGDGFTDVMRDESMWTWNAGTSTWTVLNFSNELMNNKSGQFTEPSTAHTLVGGTVPGDGNGDGRTDGFVWGVGSTFSGYFSSVGDGTYGLGGGVTVWSTGLSSFVVGDFNGDGCQDSIGIATSGSQIVYNCNPAVATASVPNFTGTVIPGDFNGDGLSDLLVVNGSTVTLYLGTGTGLTSGTTVSYSGTPSVSTWQNYQIVTGDWNGDGKTDLAFISHTSGTAHAIALSTGTGFMPLTTISNSDTTASAVVADWNNDGADDLWLQFTTSTHDTEYTFAYTPELMTVADNGIGYTTTATYDRLNKNGTLYTKGTSATYSLADLDGPFYVVKQLDRCNGVGGTYSWTYAYAGAITDVTAPPSSGPKSNLTNTGFISFSSIATTDVQTGVVQTTNLHTDIPYVGLPSSTTLTQGGVTLSALNYTYTAVATSGAAAATELTQTVLARHDVTSTAYPTITMDYTYDSYVNPLTVTMSLSDGSSETVTNTFNNDTTNWILGQLATRTDQHIVGSSNVTRHFSYSYGTSGAGTLGEMTGAALESGTTALELDAAFTYDAFGNRLTTYLSGSGITARTVLTSTYDGVGRFPATAVDAQSLSSSASFNADFGSVASATDKDTLSTSLTYDSFGRTTGVTNKDGTKVGMTYAYCSGVNGGSASCLSHGAVLVTTTPYKTDGTTQNGPISIAYFDALGRSIGDDMQGFSGSWIRRETQYDAYLHVGQTSRPYFVSGGTAYWTVYSYVIASTSTLDPFGRIWSVTAPDSSVTSYAYNALATTTTDANSHATTTTLNAQGLVASVLDANSHTTSYVYDSFGDVTQVTDPGSSVMTATYDTRGRKTAQSDPDMGSWTFSHDVLSEMTSQTDAKSQTATFTYDLDGRPKRRADSDLTTLETFDGGGSGGNYGFGRPFRDCNASTCSASTFQRTYTYNSKAQVTAVAVKADGTTYTYSLGYDSTSGRLSTMTYPSGFVAKYDYNSYGYLADIKNNATSALVWTANARNAELQLTQSTAGNNVITTDAFDPNTGRVLSICASTNSGSCDGNRANFAYDWDSVGNLAERDDVFQGKTEKFCYDVLNRLNNASTGSTCSTGTHVFEVYSPAGNDQRKSDVCTGSACIGYGSSAGPHALTSITGTVNGITNPTFTYDADGNMTAGLGRTITWTSYNMVSEISQGTTTVDWQYGPDRLRYKKCLGGCTSPTTTTLYLKGPAYSEKVTSGATTTWNDYITAEGEIVALHFKTGSTETMRYVVSDHLGSPSVITDASGAAVERDSYDAWGRRRNADFSADGQPCSLTSQSARGFTGQEHNDNLCLEDFNGRMYDPLLGRFLNADPIIPDSLNGQSFNRYSYANDNPLNAVDPTGHVSQPTPTPTQCSSQADHCGCFDCFMYGTLDTMLDYVASLDRQDIKEALNNGSGGGGVGTGTDPGDPSSTGANNEYIGLTMPVSNSGGYAYCDQFGCYTLGAPSTTGKSADGTEETVVNGGQFFSWRQLSSIGPSPLNISKGQLTYGPRDGGTDGGMWAAIGGRTMNIHVNNSNALGFHGWEGGYSVYPIDKNGQVVPQACSAGTNCGNPYIGALMPPMMDHTFTYTANFNSPTGLYLWVVNLGETRNITADNQIDFQFSVSVSNGP